MTQAPRRRTLRVRRPHSLVGYWEGDRFVVHDFMGGTRVAVPPIVVKILNLCSTSRELRWLAERLPEYDQKEVHRLVRVLIRKGLLQELDRKRQHSGAVGELADAWSAWNPAAGFFHFSTKDMPYPRSPEHAGELWRRLGPRTPMPAPLKQCSGGRRIVLPRAAAEGPFPDVLLARRTWREFAKAPVELDRLSTLLRLTWGVQRWATVPGQGKVALKTSPSGGARHSGEVYVLARRVAGLRPGLYHYDPAGGALTSLGRRSALPIGVLLPGQLWYRNAPVLLIMTAVFERAQWRYGFPRGYRAVLIEAGHLCQTCVLVATWLGLAPFCSMAFPDSRVEAMLGLDGVTESALYIAGVGIPPPGGWRPWSPHRRDGAKDRSRRFE